MKLIYWLLPFSLTAADITVTVDAPPGTTVTLSITVPPTNHVARRATFTPIPMPPMPPLVAAVPRTNYVSSIYVVSTNQGTQLITYNSKGVSIRQINPLPNGRNRTYSEHLDSLPELGMKRRNE